MDMSRKLAAEFLGTFWLVFCGCGAAVLAAHGIGNLGIALAFGFALISAAYAFGPDAHFNPALTLAAFLADRTSARDLLPYWIAQFAGAIVAAAVLYTVARGLANFDVTANFAVNGYGEHSPQQYSMEAGLVAEAVLTFLFALIVLNAQRAHTEFAPLAMGLAFAAAYLVALPITGASLNPARSTAMAVMQNDWAVDQLWAFWVAPFFGAAMAGLIQRWLAPK